MKPLQLQVPPILLVQAGVEFRFRQPSARHTQLLLATLVLPLSQRPGGGDLELVGRASHASAALVGLLWEAQGNPLGALDTPLPPEPWSETGLLAYGSTVLQELSEAGMTAGVLYALFEGLLSRLGERESRAGAAAQAEANFTAP